MKNIILTITILLSLQSCTKEDTTDTLEVQLLGSWQLVEIFGLDGAGATWSTIEDGYTYSFTEDGTFTSTRFSGCAAGVYNVSDNMLTLNFPCEGFNTGIEDEEGNFVESAVIVNGFLILTPTYQSCDEGCDYKFQRINND